MPKKNIEIKQFDKGIVSTAASKDVNENTPKYSRNIESQLADGRLQGVNKDTVLTTSGFTDFKMAKGAPYLSEVDIRMGHTNTSHLGLSTGANKATTISNLTASDSNDAGELYQYGIYAKMTQLRSQVTGQDLGGGAGVEGNMEELDYLLPAGFSYLGYNPSYMVEIRVDTNNKSPHWDEVMQGSGNKQLILFDQTGHMRLLSNIDGTNPDFIKPTGSDSVSFRYLNETNPSFFNTDFKIGQLPWESAYPGDGTPDHDATNDGWMFSAGKLLNPFHLYFLKINNKGVYFKIKDTSELGVVDNGYNNKYQEMVDFSNSNEIDNTPPLHEIEMDCSMANSGINQALFLNGIATYLNDAAGTSPFLQEINLATYSYSAEDGYKLNIKFNEEKVPIVDTETNSSRLQNFDLAIQYVDLDGSGVRDGIIQFNDPNSMFNKGDVNPAVYGTASHVSVETDLAEDSIVVSTSEFVTLPDKTDKNKINLIGISTNENDIPQKIVSIEDIHSNSVGGPNHIKNAKEGDFNASPGEYNLLAESDNVLVGLGGNSNTASKVILETENNPLTNNNSAGLQMEDAALKRPFIDKLLGSFSEFLVHPLEGYSTNIYGAIYNDNEEATYDNSATQPGGHPSDGSGEGWNRTITYDFVLENDVSLGSVSLYEGLTGSAFQYHATDGLNNDNPYIQVGQIFILDGTNDFEDYGMRTWKRYDYDITATLAKGDLFMFCGYIAGTDDVPILRYIGNTGSPVDGNDDDNTVGTPAFAYAFKENDSKIYKISLTSTGAADDDTAFPGTSAGVVQDKNDFDYAINNTGQRIAAVSLNSLTGWSGTTVSALSICTSPSLYNSINLQGEDEDPHGLNSNIYYKTGDVKLVYRHGVFYIASHTRKENLFRINLIDFYDLTEDGPKIESLGLDFTNIPSQLHAEDGNGIIRRTIEDQLTDNDWDPKKAENWTSIPTAAHIIGICETFEGGQIYATTSGITTWAGHPNVIEIQTRNANRLTTGDHVRFCGFDTATDASRLMNQQRPLEVNCTGTGHFLVDADEDVTPVGGHYISPHADIAGYWWNSKVWVLYGKSAEATTFNDWDMFLYSANTTNLSSSKTLAMADRTPPYNQARYYINNHAPSTDEDQTLIDNRVFYPGQFAFLKDDTTPGWSTTSGEGLLFDDVVAPGTDIEGESNNNGRDLVEFGIYDKSGRWTCNGIDHVLDAEASRPTDWPGGKSGPDIHNIFGYMEWGHNIGWVMDGPEQDNIGRKISPIRNSLHPHVYHSCIYKSWEVWPGAVIEPPGGTDFSQDPSESVGIGSDELQNNDNHPRHAVTFLGKTFGDFVVAPGVITREYRSDNEYNTPDWDYTFTNGWDNDSRRYIKHFNDDFTLYTIDDYSGHKGILKAFEAGCVGDIENTSDSVNKIGLVHGWPNWGGPEIEHPYAIANDDVRSGGTGDHVFPDDIQVGTHSSVNGGYPNPTDASTNKGWDGYTPPSLFNPGQGYYVYINRAWKCHSPFHPGTMDMNIEGPNEDYGNGQYVPTPRANEGWGFQFITTGESTSQEPGPTNMLHSNRWHNFSTTAIADSSTQAHGEFTMGDLSSIATEEDIERGYVGWPDVPPFTLGYCQSRFHSPFWNANGHGLSSRDNAMKVRSSRMYSICTMHKIDLSYDDVSTIKINNVHPIVMFSNANRTKNASNFASNDIELNGRFFYPYRPGYVCGIQRKSGNSTLSGALVLTTNFDSIFNMYSYDVFDFRNHEPTTGFAHPIGNPQTPSLFIRTSTALWPDWPDGTGGLFNANHIGYYPLLSTGTHYAEVINLTGEATNFQPGTPANADAMQLRALGVDTYTNAIGDDMKIFPKAISSAALDGIVDDWDDVWVNVSSNDSEDVFFGEETTFFKPYHSTGAVSTTLLTDCGGTFDDSGDIFTPDEIADKDGTIKAATEGYFTLTPSSSSTVGTLQPGTYLYKFAFEYDNAYDSPLQDSQPFNTTLVDITGDNHVGYDYIQLDINIPLYLMNNISPRVTGMTLYRKFNEPGFGDAGDYSLLESIKFNDSDWRYNSEKETYYITKYDRGNIKSTYTNTTGLPESIVDTNLNYGLSVIHHGYLYVSQAWHSELDDVKRYIFRSAPNNFFAFNWIDDYVIMPEIPIAMVSYNSRLYVWGKRKLYKVDPYNLIIEEEYEGVSIANKFAFVKTEYGLFFLDNNNIYLHDGNKPTPIANPILHITDPTIVWDDAAEASQTSGYYKIQQGYLELLKSTLDNGHKPNLFYLAKNHSLIVSLSDEAGFGKTLLYNIKKQRWDLVDSPTPISVSSSKDSNVLINDESQIFNFLGAVSKEYSHYNRKDWDWISKDLVIGTDTQDKVFKTLTLSGLPTIYNYANDSVATFNGNDKNDSIQVFLDNEQINLTLDTKRPLTEDFGKTQLLSGIVAGTDLDASVEYFKITSRLRTRNSVDGVDTTANSGINSMQTFLKPGHYIKIDDEIMFIVDTINHIMNSSTGEPLPSPYTAVQVLRGQLGTTAATHKSAEGTGTVDGDDSNTSIIYSVSPKFKFPGGTKGKHLELRLHKQTGHVDSIGIVYKYKSVK